MAITNVHRIPHGPGAYALDAQYVHTSGAAEETLKVEGIPYAATLHSEDAVGSHHPVDCQYTYTTSGAISTITFLNGAAIAAGKLHIECRTGG